MAYTLHEPREINNAADMRDEVSSIKIDPDPTNLAMPFIKRKPRDYDPVELEDRERPNCTN